MQHKKPSRLQKLLAEPDHVSKTKRKKFVTTIEACEKWISILNEELFGGSLDKIDEIDIRRRRMAYAYYEYYPVRRRRKDWHSKLCMSSHYVSEKFFVEILAHELVHHYQYTHQQPMGHGPSFKAWKRIFGEKGLHLTDVYREEQPSKPSRGHKEKDEVEQSQTK